MSDGKIVFTLKGGTGYDQPWVVISGDTVEEAVTHLRTVTTVLGEVQTAAALFHGAGSAAVLTQPQQQAAQHHPPLQIPQQQSAPVGYSNGAATSCAHGPRTRREGTSARGKWVAWFCPLAKGTPGQCEGEFEK